MNKKQIESIVSYAEKCNIVDLNEIVETICGMNPTREECAKDRPTYVDMIEGTLEGSSTVFVGQVYDALTELGKI